MLNWPWGAWVACTIQPIYTRMLVRQSKALWHRPSGTISVTHTLNITHPLPPDDWFFYNYTVITDSSTLYTREVSCHPVKWNTLRDTVWFITFKKPNLFWLSPAVNNWGWPWAKHAHFPPNLQQVQHNYCWLSCDYFRSLQCLTRDGIHT